MEINYTDVQKLARRHASGADADDIAQEICLLLLERGYWHRHIATEAARRIRRKHGRHSVVADLDPDMLPAAENTDEVAEEKQEKIQRLLARGDLSWQQKAALRLMLASCILHHAGLGLCTNR